MNYDWQAFLDGSLDPVRHAEHEAELARNHHAVAELEALKALRDTVKRAVTSAVIVPAPRRRPFRLVPFVAAAVAALAIAVAVVPRPEAAVVKGPDAMRFDTSAVMAKSPRSADFASSLSWVRNEIGYSIPDIDLGERAQFSQAMHGGEWACFDFTEGGQSYHLFIRRAAPQLEQGERVRLDCEGEFFQGQGIGWRTNGLSYYLTGTSSKNLKRIAARIAPQTSQT